MRQRREDIKNYRFKFGLNGRHARRLAGRPITMTGGQRGDKKHEGQRRGFKAWQRARPY